MRSLLQRPPRRSLRLDLLLNAVGHRVEAIAQGFQLIAGMDLYALREISGRKGLGRALYGVDRPHNVAADQQGRADRNEETEDGHQCQQPHRLLHGCPCLRISLGRQHLGHVQQRLNRLVKRGPLFFGGAVVQEFGGCCLRVGVDGIEHAVQLGKVVRKSLLHFLERLSLLFRIHKSAVLSHCLFEYGLLRLKFLAQRSALVWQNEVAELEVFELVYHRVDVAQHVKRAQSVGVEVVHAVVDGCHGQIAVDGEADDDDPDSQRPQCHLGR